MAQNTDVYHITVAGVNPHEIAAELQYADGLGGVSVRQHIMDNGQMVGGIVECWAGEHLTPAQESYLDDHSHVIDVRHVWPE